jgi:uncharacterized protein
MTDRQMFRILSLDGGGIKGTFTAACLASIEEMTGKKLVEYFDLITGTSTGGIIAVGLGLGVSSAELLKLYAARGPEIFPISRPGPLNRLKEKVRHLFRPKHSQDVLMREIEGVLGERRLGESRARLVIPAFDGNRGSVQLFKTAHTPDYKQDYQCLAKTVAVGTAAAPTYFQAYTDASGACYLDGGLWANCPAVVGLLEAIYVLGHDAESIEMLSIGTTTCPYHVDATKRSGGLLSWANGIADAFMQAQVQAVLGQAKLMIGDRMLRVDADAAPNRFCLDDAATIAELRNLGVQAARRNEKAINERFLFAPAAPFAPYYVLNPPAQAESLA